MHVARMTRTRFGCDSDALGTPGKPAAGKERDSDSEERDSERDSEWDSERDSERDSDKDSERDSERDSDRDGKGLGKGRVPHAGARRRWERRPRRLGSSICSEAAERIAPIPAPHLRSGAGMRSGDAERSSANP